MVDSSIDSSRTASESLERNWVKSYPSGVAADIQLSKYSSIVELFQESCRKFGRRVAYRNFVGSMQGILTFAELEQAANDFAAFLQNKTTLKRGDRIAIQMPNVLQYPVALFGALKAGLVVVNTNPLYTTREMEHQFKDSGAKAIVILANFADKLEEILPNTKIETVIVTQLGDLLGWPKSFIANMVIKHVKKMVPKYNLPHAITFFEALDLGRTSTLTPVMLAPEDIAFLQYTGGTTGVAKGAMLTHQNIIANMLQIVEWMKPLLEEGTEDVVTALPLYHIFSLTVNGLAMMNFGATNILITNPKDIPAFIKILQTQRWTILTGVNTLFNALMHDAGFSQIDFSRVKISVAGGMALQKAVAEKWKSLTKTNLVEGYGLTETSPVACCNPIHGGDRAGTIGLPLPSTYIKFIDDDGKTVPLSESGELCIKGPQVMRGYWQKPDETAKVLTEDGWLKTGDVALMEQDGFVRIVDRKKDMILVSGFNVYPNEIEDVVAACPGVLEVAAIGVPDATSGEAVKIFVVKKDPELSAETIKDFCKKNLTGYKVPRQIEFRESLPKTNVGKILRRALR